MVPSFLQAAKDHGWTIDTIGGLLEKKALVGLMDGNHGNLYPRSEEFADEGVPYISATNFLNNRVNYAKVKHLPEDRAAKLKKGIAKHGDVLFAHNATVGPVALLETILPRVILSTSVTYHRCNPDQLHNKFWLAYLESPFFQRQVERIMRQTTRSQVPITAQKELWATLPPLPEQRKIADILSTWDRAIETTEALLATARTQKRALMQTLLTGKRRFTEFIGQSWQSGGLELLAEIQMGQSPAGETYNSDGIGTPLINGPTEFTERSPVARQWTTKPTKICQAGDVLVCVRGSSTGRMNIADSEYCIGRGVAAVRKRDGLTDTVYLQQLLHSLVELVLSRAAGSTFPNIDKKSLNAIQVHIPPLDAQRKIGAVLGAADDEIDMHVDDIEKLRTEKKALMQQLLTGKRRVVADA